ncbi:MAG: spore germination protein [Oscillospiraceae bacterium]|nr:spore germination protein [Oscillospiraceae bacterium]
MEKTLPPNIAQTKRSLKESFGDSADFYMKDITIGGHACCICTLEGLSSLEKLWIMMLDAVNDMSRHPVTAEELFLYIWKRTSIPVDQNIVTDYPNLIKFLTAGTSVILIEGLTRGIVVSTQSMQYRSVGEPSGEGNLRGSREGFTEPLRVNISLVRRLIRSEHLYIETSTIGVLTKTEVAVFYHKDTVPESLLKQVKQQLSKIKLQMLFDTGYLAPFLDRHPLSLFTVGGYTERPETVAAKLCEGKIAIMVNGSPFALIVPTFFSENFQSMDDYSQRPYFATFIRLLKYAAFLIAILLPGIFVAIANFTPELFPAQMLYKVAAAEQATPMPLFVEALFVNFLLEIVREAGLRLPKPIGHSVSLVSALIIGDAAIKAGLLGTPIIVVAALTSITSYVIPSLYEPIIILRVLFILAGGIIGPIGIVALGLFLILNICSIESFGVPYTAPLTPYNSSVFKDGLVRASWKKLSKKRFTIQDLPGAGFGDEK